MAILSLGICPKCGNATDTTARYCEHCAADLGEIRRPVHPTPDQQAKQAQTKTEEASEVKSLRVAARPQSFWPTNTFAGANKNRQFSESFPKFSPLVEAYSVRS